MARLVAKDVSTPVPPVLRLASATPATLHIKDNSHQFRRIVSAPIGISMQERRLVHLAILLASGARGVLHLVRVAMLQLIGL